MERIFGTVTAALFVWLVCAEPASAQDRGDRTLRLDNDGIRNELREDRLKVPVHPIFPDQQQVAPHAPSKGKARSKRSGEAPR
jgi:hypothetical protein